MPYSKIKYEDQKLTVAIAGAGGYIGRWLIKEYRHKFNFVALSRQKVDQNPYPEVEWRQVELYSITSTVEAEGGGCGYLFGSLDECFHKAQSRKF